MARSLIVLPEDSTRRIVGAIEQAKRSLRIKMFAFSDATLLNAVLAAKRRGVAVQVMLNQSAVAASATTITRAGCLHVGMSPLKTPIQSSI